MKPPCLLYLKALIIMPINTYVNHLRGPIMYYAHGIRDLLLTTQLNLEFFDHLTEFQIHFIDMCFKQSIDDKMGLMTDVEQYNYHLFQEYKSLKFQEDFGINEEILKKIA